MKTAKKNPNAIKRTQADAVFDVFNTIFMIFVLVIIAYPLYFVVLASVSDPYLVEAGEVWLWPKGINLIGYKKVLGDARVWTGLRNSALYTVLGVAASLAITLPAAYALSRKDLPFVRGISFICVFTMLFNGGLVATYYMVAHLLKLENTLTAMILPSAVSVYHLMVARTFMQTNIPIELREAAQVDGCGETRFFLTVVLPLSTSLIATLVLMFSVIRWNSYVDALLYLTEARRFPLQTVIKEILLADDATQQFDSGTGSNIITQQQIVTLVKYSVILICNIPVVIIYPLVQKYLVKGILVGAVKG